MKVKNHLQELIAECEEKLGYTVRQQDVAEASDITQATLSRYINGHPNSAKFEVEYKLCAYFTKTLERPINRGDLFSFEFDLIT